MTLCQATNPDGTPCPNPAEENNIYCKLHGSMEADPLPDWVQLPDCVIGSPIEQWLRMWIVPEALRRGYKSVWLRANGETRRYLPPVKLTPEPLTVEITFLDSSSGKKPGDQINSDEINWEAFPQHNDKSHILIDYVEVRWEAPGKILAVLFNNEVDLSDIHGHKISSKPDYGFIKWDLESGDQYIYNPLDALKDSQPQQPAVKTTTRFNVPTNQEFDALLQSMAGGRQASHWHTDEQALSRIWDAGLQHYVKLSLEPDEVELGTQALESLTSAQDANSCIAMLYVANLLQPDAPLPDDLERNVWVDLLDVARKSGILIRESAQAREEAVSFIWDVLRYGARASVCGRRNGKYFDKKTGMEIDTEVEGPMWMLGHKERPTQGSLFPSMEIPIRQRVTITKEWERLMFDSNLAQYLPCGELIGAIPAKKPSGAWSRVVGLALVNFWRRNPQASLQATLRPSRRELLTRYVPGAAVPQDVLGSSNPQRAITYWVQALGILVDQGLLERLGEAARTAGDIKASLPRYNWQQQWIDEEVELHPGPAIVDAIRKTADALPKAKPRKLSAKNKKAKSHKS